MFEKIRKPKKTRSYTNYIVYMIIFGMIVASFIFMIPGMNGGSTVNAAAEVGSTTISLRDYNEQLKSQRRRYAQMFNGEIPSFFENNLKRQVLESMVKREVLSQYAQEKGLYTSEIEVSEFIKNDIPAFQKEGVFSPLLYDQYLRSTRTSVSKFEELIAKDLTNQKLFELFSNSMPKSQLEETVNKAAESVEVRYKLIELSDEALKKSAPDFESKIQAYLEDGSNLQALKENYEAHKEKYSEGKRVQLSYLVVQEKEKADEIAAKINTGNFADIAKEKSEDSLSKEKGGDLGYIAKGDFGPQIEDKAFSMAKGEITKEPFKTDLGYAFLYVRDVKEENVKSFEEVKPELALEKIKESLGVEARKEISKALKENPENLAALLSSYGLSWGEGQVFLLSSNSLPGVGESELIISKLLGLKKGAVYENIVSFEDKNFLIKLVDLSTKSVAEKQSLLSQNENFGNRGMDFLELLYGEGKKSIDIRLNTELLRQ